jgi:glutamate carboxypeptidase
MNDSPVQADLSAELVMDLVSRRQDEMVSLLEALVQLETPSTDADAAATGLKFVGDHLDVLGYQVTYRRSERTGGWLVASPPTLTDSDDVQLLVGHVDTVWPIGTLESMPLTVVDGRVDGPGSFDMKSGLVQIILALRVIDEMDVQPVLRPVVLVNTDEEIGSPESTFAIERLSERAQRAFVLEPPLGPKGAIKTRRKGATRYNIEVRGRAAHAGLDPSLGSNAIAMLAEVVQKLFALNDPGTGVTVNVGMIEGGTRPNVVPESARAVVDVRAPTRADVERIDQEIRKIDVDPARGSIDIIRVGGRPPMEATPGSRRLWSQALAAADALQIELDEAMAGGASDGNTTSQFCPTIDGLGAVGAGAHAAHEHIIIDRMLERTALLILLLLAPDARQSSPA